MSWRESLIRISNHEVDTLQKRLGEIVGRREAAQMRLVMLAAEAEAEMAHIDANADMGWSRAGFLAGVKARREQIMLQIEAIAHEEAGARDALAGAFESLKKFEHVAEVARLARRKEEDARETAAMDEMGRRTGTRG